MAGRQAPLRTRTGGRRPPTPQPAGAYALRPAGRSVAPEIPSLANDRAPGSIRPQTGCSRS